MHKRGGTVSFQLYAVFAALLMSACLLGCGVTKGSGSTSTTSGISVTLATAPPANMTINQTTMLMATVANDSAGGGVDWSCTPSGACGSFNPAHTASGANTTYTAPGAAGSVTIKAASATNAQITATATVTVTASTSNLSVTLSTAPPANLAASQTATIAATVANDSAAKGVDWSCTPSGACGSFNPAHTASGANTTYTAPGAAGSVTIKAASTTTPTVSASATVIVGASSASPLTSGTFTFYVSGEDAKSNTYAIVGSVVLDANGNVTGGEQDFNSVGGATSTEPGGDKITGGKLTPNGSKGGSLTVVTNNSAVGVKGTETFTLAAVNTKHALIAEFDASATSSGSMDFQTLSPGGLAQINGPFVMVVSGKDGSKQEVFGGLVDGHGDGTLHVNIDQNQAGTLQLNGTNTGTYTAPDTAGRGTIAFGGDQFAYYVVGAKVLRAMVTSSGTNDVGSVFAGVSGASNATLNSKLFFTDASNLSSGASFVAAGQLTADGKGNITGFADVNENGHATSAAITGTYTLNASGYGSITIKPGNTQDVSTLGIYLTDPTINFSDPNSPVDAGARGLLIDLDTKIVGNGMLIVPPSGTTTLSGNFAFGIQSNSTNESDAVGTASIKTNALTGAEALNDLFGTGQGSNLALSGTTTADATNAGRFTIPVSVTVSSTSTLKPNYVLYQVSTSQVVLIEVDTHLGAGILEVQH